jgi:hypothetical protein
MYRENEREQTKHKPSSHYEAIPFIDSRRIDMLDIVKFENNYIENKKWWSSKGALHIDSYGWYKVTVGI